MINIYTLKPKLKDLRIPTVLEQGVDTSDGQGGVDRVWTPKTDTIFVSDDPKSYKDVSEGGSINEIMRHWIMMRYNPELANNINPNFKWRFNGDYGVWYIEVVLDPFDSKVWQLAITTEVPQ